MEKTFDKDDYTRRSRETLDSLLQDPLLSIDVDALTASELRQFLDERTTNAKSSESSIKNTCTFEKIIGFSERYWYKTFKVGILENCLGNQYDINYSIFKYYQRPLIAREGWELKTISEGVVASLNGRAIIPESLFENENNIGENLLFLYSFSTVNDFNKQNRCYRFMDVGNCSHQMQVDGVLSAQLFILNKIVKLTGAFAPLAIILVNGHIDGQATNGEITKFFVDIFKSEYYSRFMQLLHMVENRVKSRDFNFVDQWILNV